MNLLLTRDIFSDASTLAPLTLDGKPGFYTCEDRDRGLDARMPLSLIQSLKVPTKTAIPVGRYRLEWRWSKKHKANVPWLMDVPGFQCVEMHVGNTPYDTDACILVGTRRGDINIGHSQAAIDWLYPRIQQAIAGRGAWLEITRDPTAWDARVTHEPGLAWAP